MAQEGDFEADVPPRQSITRLQVAAVPDRTGGHAEVDGCREEHRAKLHGTNPVERPNGETRRRTEVVGIFPNDEAIVRLVGAILLEQNDEWAVQRSRYLTSGNHRADGQ